MQNIEEKNGKSDLTRSHLSGEVKRVRFASPESGFGVIIITDAKGREYTLCGSLATVREGEFIEADGKYEKHPEFGRQLRVESYRISLPRNNEGIEKYLISALPGIGPKTAAAIVGYFGEKTIKIIDETPKRLLEIPGFGRKRLDQIVKVWKASATRRDELVFMQGLGISPAFCSRIFRRYGDNAVELLRRNPYRLADEVDGIGFLKADAIAAEMGIPHDSPDRLAAAAVFAMNRLVESGNVCTTAEILAGKTVEAARISPEQAGEAIKHALGKELLVQQGDKLYIPFLALLEDFLPRIIDRLAKVSHFAGKKMLGNQKSKNQPRILQLAPEQQLAVDRVSEYPLSIITGGPGVGKTTVVGEIVRRAKAAKLDIALAAPTGRAAKRLSEATGLPAKTLHRLLGFDPSSGKFQHNVSYPLPCDILIVDEVSMLDLPLAAACFGAVKPGTSVVLVGDADQLPSVGPGRVLADLMNSGYFSVTRLQQIFRQAESSSIIRNAHLVNRGAMPQPPAVVNGGVSDFYWIEQEDPDLCAGLIVKMVAERIPKRFGLDPVDDVQILVPMNRGNCGTSNLNAMLAAALNPEERPSLTVGERSFKTGDKVMQIANNYDKNVFNGDLGRISWVSEQHRKFAVNFDGGERTVEYSADEMHELVPAYAITIHKSQGSEFPAVVVPILNQHFVMLRRNLLYTAMTRAKKLLILIGSRKAVEMAVRNARIEPRLSELEKKLNFLRKKG